MGRPNLVLLHKTEWDRLNKQAGPPEAPKHNIEDLKALMGKSQAWIRTWPDTVEGHVTQLTKQKKKLEEEKIELAKASANMKKQLFKAEAVNKARQQIFEDSAYGKRLISALIESKTIEERDVQIKFQKQLKQIAAVQEKAQSKLNIYCSFNLDAKEAEKKREQKSTTIDCALYNKDTHQTKLEIDSMNREKEKILEKEDARLMEQLLINEGQQKDKIKQLEKQALQEHEADQDKIRKQRILREYQHKVHNELYRKHQEQIKCKIQHVLKQVHGDRQEKTLSKNVYKHIENCQEEREKRYKFIDERIAEKEQQDLKKENDDAKKLKQGRNTSNRVIHEYGNESKFVPKINACVCDRQTLIIQSRKPIKKICEKATKYNGGNIECLKETKLPFFAPRNKLLEALKKRANEPSPWNGANAAHEQFARQADRILQECQYKTMARKAVDDYRKLNCLDCSTLPVPHY